MERFEAGGCTVYVDYAHTPDALERILRTAREANPSRLTVVFGCGGERDASKRPIMGGIAADNADRCILTTDNPRSEDPANILAEIQAGMSRPAEVEPDRARAIALAIRDAIPGEILVVAGKGAETVQIVGATRTYFDDRAEVRKQLDRRGKGA
jgi:UDP-N-acetylmuramoyl-L-alanyl-D-glutamate--2,6-diaminopimelate ligase